MHGAFDQALKDYEGYKELDITTDTDEKWVATCRNIAADTAKKLNKINESYNARILICDSNGFKNFESNNVVVPLVETEKKEEKSLREIIDDKLAVFTGNHVVVLVDIKEEEITLVLDPTNRGIGLYKDGDILMFNTKNGDVTEFISKEYATIINGTGLDGFFSVVGDHINSYKNKSKLSFKEIKEKYGLEAQNRAIDEYQDIEFKYEEQEIIKENLKKQAQNNINNVKNFKDRFKVEIDYNEELNDYKVNVKYNNYDYIYEKL